jgi:hypothetical protein
LKTFFQVPLIYTRPSRNTAPGVSNFKAPDGLFTLLKSEFYWFWPGLIIFTGCSGQEYPGRPPTGAYWKKNLRKQVYPLPGVKENSEHQNSGKLLNVH